MTGCNINDVTTPTVGPVKLNPDAKHRGAISRIGNVKVFYSLAELEAVVSAIRAGK